MTMNDHEVVRRLLKITTWSLGLRCILRQIRKRLREFSIFKQLHNKFLVMNLMVPTDGQNRNPNKLAYSI